MQNIKEDKSKITNLIKGLIDWKPKFTLKEGLLKTYEIMKIYSQNR